MVESTGISARVQRGYEAIQHGRFEKRAWWGAKLTILDGETASLPLVIRKALAIKKVMSEMPIEIREYELLVGSTIAENLETLVPFPEYATQQEKETAAYCLTGTKSVFGHFCPYYPKYLKRGLGGLRKMADERLDRVRRNGVEREKETWYESVILSLDGLIALIRRYMNLASELASNTTNLTRKRELEEIGIVSQHLLNKPPQTFREALQAIWFAHIAFSSTMNLLPLGRFDQNLWPYLKSDLEKGVITIDEAQELVDLFWLKCNERLQTYELLKETYLPVDTPMSMRARVNVIGSWSLFLGGMTSHDRVRYDGGTSQQFLQTITLAGLTPEGLDGTNLLTYLCLNSTLRLRTPQPCLYVRFHDNSPTKLYQSVADCLRAGCVSPTIYNDEVIVPAFKKSGFPLEHARDYTSDGCWEIYIQGRTHFKYGIVSVAEALDRVLSPGSWKKVEALDFYLENFDPYKDYEAPDPYTFHSFNEVMDSVMEQIDMYVKCFIETVELMRDGRLYFIAPVPLLSAFMLGPLESGRDVTQEGTEYGQHSPLLVGLSHAADSLAVIKRLCFEENSIEWTELLDMIRNNWQDRECVRQRVMTRVPAYGNDLDYVDDIAREIVECFVESVRKHSANTKSGINYLPGIGTFELYADLGRLIGATPDGRLAREPLSSNASPSIGRPVNGQTAAINSFVKLPLIDLPVGSALDLNIEKRGGLLQHLESLIKSFVQKRGNVLSISVNDCEMLRNAQKEPEKYRDLKVRVGGYDAYFVDLPAHHQELQIKRCEQYA